MATDQAALESLRFCAKGTLCTPAPPLRLKEVPSLIIGVDGDADDSVSPPVPSRLIASGGEREGRGRGVHKDDRGVEGESADAVSASEPSTSGEPPSVAVNHDGSGGVGGRRCAGVGGGEADAAPSWSAILVTTT